MNIQRLYDTAPKVVQAQVDALLGRGARRTSPDAGKPWGPDEQASLVEGMKE